MNKDIEQRAVKKYPANSDTILTTASISTYDLVQINRQKGYIAGATEEREKGKRFAEWASEYFTYNAKNNEWKHKGSHLIISTDELFDMLLSEEKALNKNPKL